MTTTQVRIVIVLLVALVFLLATLVMDGAHRDSERKSQDLIEQIQTESGYTP